MKVLLDGNNGVVVLKKIQANSRFIYWKPPWIIGVERVFGIEHDWEVENYEDITEDITKNDTIENELIAQTEPRHSWNSGDGMASLWPCQMKNRNGKTNNIWLMRYDR